MERHRASVTRRWQTSALALLLTLWCVSGAEAQPAVRPPSISTGLWELEIPDYPGFLEAAGLPHHIERARSLIELVRIVHRAPGDYDTSARIIRERVLAHLKTAARRPTTTVPSPLPPRAWRDLLPVSVDERDLASAIIANREAALMYLGLMSVDRETREALANQRRLLQQLTRVNAGAVAAFAQALVVRGGRVEVPGGTDAEPLWSALAGVGATDLERFVPVLFSADGGRLAYFYGAVASADPAHQSFLLERGLGSTAQRIEAFRATYALIVAADRPWEPNLRPFSNATLDFESVAQQVEVDEQGRPVGLISSEFWDGVFGVVEPGSSVARGVVTPAWLAARLLFGDRIMRRDRYESLLFAQRVFPSLDASGARTMVEMFRTFGRYRALYFTLERMGVRDPAIYRAAALRAGRLRADGSDEAFVDHVLFQGCLALLERAAFFGTLEQPGVEGLVRSLLAVDVTASRSYRQPVLTWIAHQFVPALAARVGGDPERIDDVVLRGMAGTRKDAVLATVVYEDTPYAVDPAGGELVRLQRVREQQAAMRLEPVVQFSERLTALVAGVQVADSAQQNVRALAALLADLRQELVGLERDSRHAEALRDDAADAEHVLATLGAREAGAVPAAALRTLNRFADRAAADALLAWVYATALGDPQGAPVAGGDVARRHDFGLRGLGEDQRRLGPWALPVEDTNRNRTWRALGSLLGLDIAFSRLALRRMDGEYPPQPPTLAGFERLTLAQASALRSAFTLTDADRDAIAARVRRGRARLAELSPQTPGRVEDVARELRMDGWRRAALQWSIVHDRAAASSLVTITEEYWLGRSPAENPPKHWGASRLTLTGCWCLAFPEPRGWGTVTGRPGSGLLTTRFADVAIVAALALSDLKLPAALGQGLAAMLTQTAIDYGRQSQLDDLLSLSVALRRLTRPDFEDYVASLAFDGPLRPHHPPDVSASPEPRR
jgi:hypothetical protein